MAEDSTLQSDYLRTGNLDSLKAIKDQQWAARAALEALYTRELDLVEVEGLLHLGLKATESPSEDTQQQLLRSSLLDLSSRTECFKVFTSESSSPEAHPSPNIAPLDEDESGWGLDIGDDDDEEEHHSDVQVPATSSSLASLPLSLFDLLTSELSELGLLLAQNSLSATLSDFFGRFALPNQHILRILDTLPLTLDAATLVDLFQRSITGPRQKIPDWAVAPSQTKALDIDATQWYLSRVRRLDIEAGLIDQAFLLVQHAASRGVSGLDEVGEELSLLCKLVYDRPQTPMSDSDEDWTLDRWHQSDPVHLFDSYLAHSSPSTIVHDIRRLALPYAFVLEAKAERAGQPQPDLHNEMLRSWMLSRVTMHPQQLDLAAAIIRASKPDLSPAQRLIKSDEELARISLSLVYGCSSTQHWSDMSAILDCMPALQSSNDTTPAPNFVATAAPGPIQLYLNISSFSSSQISRAMDALDVHLEQAELLARWQTPVRLSWLIQHASDAAAQRKLLNQLSSNATRAAQKAEDWLENQDDWESLMEDLVRMAKPETEIEPDLLPAFGQLSKDEVLEVFFKTLLRSGVLSTAKSLLSSSSRSRPLDPVAQEKLCLDVSRELYNNANTANLHGGDMKQAYDCLSIAPQTPAIRQEREFIEATSRIASFNLQRGGSAIIPIQIRLTKDKLQLIEEVIQSSEDAYRHPELLLELADKLGFRGDDIATLRVLDMVSSASCQRGEHEGALESVQRVVDATEGLRARKSPQSPQAAAIAWQACKRLVSQPLRGSSQQQVDLLGQALLLCPPTSVSELLSLWREAEEKLGRQASRPLSRINTSSPLGNALNLGQAGVSSYLDRPASSGSLSPAAALDTIVYGREGGVRDRLQSGMTSGLRWLVEGS